MKHECASQPGNDGIDTMNRIDRLRRIDMDGRHNSDVDARCNEDKRYKKKRTERDWTRKINA
jgi:hypothetical protein